MNFCRMMKNDDIFSKTMRDASLAEHLGDLAEVRDEAAHFLPARRLVRCAQQGRRMDSRAHIERQRRLHEGAALPGDAEILPEEGLGDRKSTRLNSSH